MSRHRQPAPRTERDVVFVAPPVGPSATHAGRGHTAAEPLPTTAPDPTAAPVGDGADQRDAAAASGVCAARKAGGRHAVAAIVPTPRAPLDGDAPLSRHGLRPTRSRPGHAPARAAGTPTPPATGIAAAATGGTPPSGDPFSGGPFSGGHGPGDTSPGNPVPSNPGTGDTVPSNPGPGDTVPSNPGTGNTGPSNPGTGNTGPSNPGPSSPGTGNTGPGNAGPGDTVPSNPGTDGTVPSNPGTGNTVVVDTGPGDAVPSDPRPGNTVAVDAGPGDAVPSDPGTGTTVPVDAGPGDAVRDARARLGRRSCATPDDVTDSTAPIRPGRHGIVRPSTRHHADGPPRTTSPRIGTRRIGTRRKSALVLVGVAVGLLALPAVSSASTDQCRWQRAAHSLLLTLAGSHDARSDALRDALTQAGVGPKLAAGCDEHTSRKPRQTGPGSAPSTTTPTTSADPTTTRHRPTATSSATPTTSSDTTEDTTTSSSPPSTTGPAATGSGSAAAAAFGWGTPEKTDDFSGGLSGWGLYDGPGHDGNGRRTPSAAAVANGIMTITGDSKGNSEGMAWDDGQKYGRWEARVRSTVGDDSYHPVMLLWPDAENWPVGGEVDWMEISDASRQDVDGFLHYGSSNDQVSGNVEVDATQWHDWAVEWSPRGITYYLDGKAWFSTKDKSILPPGPMHMTIQLDYFGGGHPKTSQMQVDWVKQYRM